MRRGRREGERGGGRGGEGRRGREGGRVARGKVSLLVSAVVKDARKGTTSAPADAAEETWPNLRAKSRRQRSRSVPLERTGGRGGRTSALRDGDQRVRYRRIWSERRVEELHGAGPRECVSRALGRTYPSVTRPGRERAGAGRGERERGLTLLDNLSRVLEDAARGVARSQVVLPVLGVVLEGGLLDRLLLRL